MAVVCNLLVIVLITCCAESEEALLVSCTIGAALGILVRIHSNNHDSITILLYIGTHLIGTTATLDVSQTTARQHCHGINGASIIS